MTRLARGAVLAALALLLAPAAAAAQAAAEQIHVRAGEGPTCVPARSADLSALDRPDITAEFHDGWLCISARHSSPIHLVTIEVVTDSEPERRQVLVHPSNTASVPVVIAAVLALVLALVGVRLFHPGVRYVAVRVDPGQGGYREAGRARVEIARLPVGAEVELGPLHPKLEGLDLSIEVERWGVRLLGTAIALEPGAGQAFAADQGSLVPPGTVLARGRHQVVLLSAFAARRALRDASAIRWLAPEEVPALEEEGRWAQATVSRPGLLYPLLVALGGAVAASLVDRGLEGIAALDLAWVHFLVTPAVAASVALAGSAAVSLVAPRRSGSSGPTRARYR